MTNIPALIIVNILTTIRILGVIVLVPVYLIYGSGYTALLAMGCYFTDFLDGIIARKFHASTFFGSAYDVLADKLFTCANLLVILSVTNFAIIPIFFEILIIIIGVAKYKRNINVQSTKMGKIKTWVMGLTVIAVYMAINLDNLTRIFGFNFINHINNIDKTILYLVIFMPLYVFELLTVISYLKFLDTYDINEKTKLPKLPVKLKPRDGMKNFWYNFRITWLNNELYEQFKDYNAQREVWQALKKNR
jgi:phosphatidylglycerophosphate synthase